MKNKSMLEIVQTHQFLESWLSGRAEKTGEVFRRFRDSLAEEFVIVYPNGQIRDREKMLADMWNAHGLRSPEFSIEIRNYQCRFASDTVCVATYEEWQRAGESSARVNTAVFRQVPDGTSLQWILVHETWLPGI